MSEREERRRVQATVRHSYLPDSDGGCRRCDLPALDLLHRHHQRVHVHADRDRVEGRCSCGWTSPEDASLTSVGSLVREHATTMHGPLS